MSSPEREITTEQEPGKTQKPHRWVVEVNGSTLGSTIKGDWREVTDSLAQAHPKDHVVIRPLNRPLRIRGNTSPREK